MLISPILPKNMWGETLLALCAILNRISYKHCDVTPYEMLKGQKPNLNSLWYEVFWLRVKIPNIRVNKLGDGTFD